MWLLLGSRASSSLAQAGSNFLPRTKGDGITIWGTCARNSGSSRDKKNLSSHKTPQRRSLWALGVQDPPQVGLVQGMHSSSRSGTSGVGTRCF